MLRFMWQRKNRTKNAQRSAEIVGCVINLYQLSPNNPQPITLDRRAFARLNLPRLAKSLLSSFFFYARTDLFLGRLRAPPDGFNNPPDTRDRPGERF
jgi:hypothetical protein